MTSTLLTFGVWAAFNEHYLILLKHATYLLKCTKSRLALVYVAYE